MIKHNQLNHVQQLSELKSMCIFDFLHYCKFRFNKQQQLKQIMSTLRESKQSSIISNSEKLKYPKCERKKEHTKESLNFVCITSTCKNRGLICVQCKSTPQHSGHNVLPLKTFLLKLQDSLKKSELGRTMKIAQNEANKSSSYQTLIQKLEESHIEILSTLRIQIEQISEKIRNVEQQIMNDYDRIKQKISSQFQKQNLLHRALDEIQSFFTQQKEKDTLFDLRLSMMKVLNLVKIQKNDILIQNEAEQQFNTYVLSVGSVKMNLLIWERQTSKIIGDIFKLKPEYQLKDIKNRPTTAIDQTGGKQQNTIFSTQFKTQSISILNQGKIARVKDDKYGKIILLNQKIGVAKGVSSKFKIVTLSASSSMQIGACVKTIISLKGYKFEKSNISHGTFFFSSNGFQYSSNDQAINNTKSNFMFKVGDEITLQVDPVDMKLLMKKKTDTKYQQINMAHLSKNDWKEVYLCVNMNSIGDKIQIIE